MLNSSEEGAKNPGVSSQWRLNFVGWRLVYVRPQCGTWLHVTLVAPRIFSKLLDVLAKLEYCTFLNHFPVIGTKLAS